MYVLQLHHPKTEEVVGTVCAGPDVDKYTVWDNVITGWDEFLHKRLKGNEYTPFDIEGFVHYFNKDYDYANLKIYVVEVDFYQPSHPPIQ